MGEDPIIVARQKDGSIKAFLQPVRYRSMRVSFADCGNTRAFTCPYHGWSYGIDGSLKDIRLKIVLTHMVHVIWGLVEVNRVKS